ncbi:MAG TPA: DUF2079 domain-containing protein [Isosphaeraceae bacterium]|jgi:hypothetical protein|nr:DUF2079 domain-containing protein [Isosphaeraceae bacterium]
MRRAIPWLLVGLLTATVTVATTRQSLGRYRALRSGWSWDLAYYNQWFRALTTGEGRVTVRPVAAYAEEGPSIWTMTYLAPIRLAIAPFYAIRPGPEALLVVHGVVFWWVIPASYMLARSESGSTGLALAASALVPTTPLLWPLAINDFRELQLALPFLIWAVDGYRGRHRGLATLGIGGMLACRQELAVVVATLAILPPREPEDIGRTYRWARGVIWLGTAWVLFGFFGYLHARVGSNAPAFYLRQFVGPRASPWQTLATSAEFVAIGLGGWALLAAWAPRAAVLALPWVWSLAGGRWALRFLATEQWHHVRYTAPIVGLGLAAGLIGLARVREGGGRRALVASWLLALAWNLAACGVIESRLARAPAPIAAEDVGPFWAWAGRVKPEEGVLASYPVASPLSSRRILYSYVLTGNRPEGYPDRLGPEFRWVFILQGDLDPEVLRSQGFEAVHRGPSLAIFRR